MAVKNVYVSYLNAGEWTIFAPLIGNFPLITHVDSDYGIGASAKALGVNLPAIHGIYPTVHPTESQPINFSFLVRSLDSPNLAISEAENFVTWLYSLDVFHLAEMTSPIYRRYKFNSVDPYKVIFGKYGYDIILNITFQPIDPMNYQREITTISTNEFSKILISDVGDPPDNGILFSAEYTDTILEVQPTIIINFNATQQSGTNTYIAFTNERLMQTIGLSFDTNYVNPANGGYFLFDCENRIATLHDNGQPGSGIPARDINMLSGMHMIRNDIIREEDSKTVINDNYLFDFPKILYGKTYIEIFISRATQINLYTPVVEFRRRWL